MLNRIMEADVTQRMANLLNSDGIELTVTAVTADTTPRLASWICIPIA